MEVDEVLQVIRHIVSQLRAQTIGDHITDIVVRAILPLRFFASRIVDILDLLLEARFLGRLVLRFANQGCLLIVCLKGQLAACHVPGKINKHLRPACRNFLIRIHKSIPDYVVVRIDSEHNRSDSLTACRYLCLGKHVFTIVQTLEDEG